MKVNLTVILLQRDYNIQFTSKIGLNWDLNEMVKLEEHHYSLSE